MSNYIKMCRCSQCIYGLRHGGWWVAKRAVRSFRRRVKEAIRRGDEPPKTIRVPYIG